MMLHINISLLTVLKTIILWLIVTSCLPAIAANSPDTPNSLLGKKFPKFKLHQVGDKKQKFSEKILTGHAKVVHFWSTRDELYKQQQQILSVLNTLGIMIIGINVQDNIPKDMNLPYSICLNDHKGKLASKLDIKTLPATFVIDDKGVIRYQINNDFSGDPWGDQVENAYKSTLIMPEVIKKMEI